MFIAKKNNTIKYCRIFRGAAKSVRLQSFQFVYFLEFIHTSENHVCVYVCLRVCVSACMCVCVYACVLV